jgi:hypothetical protein
MSHSNMILTSESISATNWNAGDNENTLETSAKKLKSTFSNSVLCFGFQIPSPYEATRGSNFQLLIKKHGKICNFIGN